MDAAAKAASGRKKAISSRSNQVCCEITAVKPLLRRAAARPTISRRRRQRVESTHQPRRLAIAARRAVVGAGRFASCGLALDAFSSRQSTRDREMPKLPKIVV